VSVNSRFHEEEDTQLGSKSSDGPGMVFLKAGSPNPLKSLKSALSSPLQNFQPFYPRTAMKKERAVEFAKRKREGIFRLEKISIFP
jgi:hypothetical protein